MKRKIVAALVCVCVCVSGLMACAAPEPALEALPENPDKGSTFVLPATNPPTAEDLESDDPFILAFEAAIEQGYEKKLPYVDAFGAAEGYSYNYDDGTLVIILRFDDEDRLNEIIEQNEISSKYFDDANPVLAVNGNYVLSTGALVQSNPKDAIKIFEDLDAS